MSCPLYQELPLDSTRRQIRILQFRPSRDTTKSSILECRMVRVSLDEDPLCEYRAVSYTWGATHPRGELRVNGHILAVPCNTFEALRTLHRHRTDAGTELERTVSIWIDAVCIDQGSLKERSEQVKIMDRVYSFSKEVLIWLGDDDGLAIETYVLIERICRHCDTQARAIADDEHLQGPKDPWSLDKPKFMYGCLFRGGSLQPPVSAMSFSKRDSELAFRLYSRPYFTRVWILQEVALAHEATCYYGQHRLAMAKIVIAAEWLRTQWFFTRPFVQVFNGASQMYTLGNVKITLNHCLDLCAGRQTTDVRDRVFGLLGLLDQDDRQKLSKYADIEPDYSKPPSAVLRDAFRYMIYEARELQNLMWILKVPSSNAEFPSWVPEKYFDDDHGGVGDFPCSVLMYELTIRDLDDPNVLSVGGIFIDTISYVHYEFDDISSDDATVRHLWNEVTCCLQTNWKEGRGDNEDVDHKGILTKVCRALGANALKTSWKSNTFNKGLSSFLDDHMVHEPALIDDLPIRAMHDYMHRGARSKAIQQSLTSQLEEQWPFLDSVASCASDRAFFQTKDGSFGLGLHGVQAGDVVVRLSGTYAPAIIREEGETCQFLGLGYLHGLSQEADDDEEWEWFDMI